MPDTANNPNRKSWISVPTDSDFPIQNIPFGVFLTRDDVITIGTRGSRLSLAQVEHVKDELLLAYPNLDPELIQIKSIPIDLL